mmetsp:Transcript_164823/g.528880  ORF Transcript_164823/g.528880 Transcript_164823/m.528880 type:complete len:291 (-) Transcript_164823:90-962(-)
MAEKMMDVADIRFTQEHVYDTFNANDERAGGVMDLVEAIMAGTKTVRDMPLIRVAVKRGAYWCVDNRRLFVYKHCQLGQIPVIIMDWKDMREFELKWKNGLATRCVTSEGRRVGILQRTDVPFPTSHAVEPSLCTITTPMTPERQSKHDAQIAALRARREKELASQSLSSGATAAAEESLRGLFAAAANPTPSRQGSKKKKLPRADVAEAEGREAAQPEAEEVAEARPKKRKKAKAKAKDSGGVAGRTGEAAGDAPVATGKTGAPGPVKLTVALAEDSDDEAYDVEVTAL